jgi:hypothetical protein
VIECLLKLINREVVDDPSDFIAAMLLQFFERPESEQVFLDPTSNKPSHRAKYASQMVGIKKIRTSLDYFFNNYIRVSPENCEGFLMGAIKAINFLIRGKVELSNVE